MHHPNDGDRALIGVVEDAVAAALVDAHRLGCERMEVTSVGEVAEDREGGVERLEIFGRDLFAELVALQLKIAARSSSASAERIRSSGTPGAFVGDDVGDGAVADA